jgi:DNA polymerase-3 subunit delta'
LTDRADNTGKTGLLATVRAQSTAVETLRRSLATDHVAHAYLFDGPDGVGKELTAWGLAQALVCERSGAEAADACGTCPACVRAVPRAPEPTPRHPDVIVLERGLYEPAAIGRRSPELQDISIDQVRTLVLRHGAFAPLEGRARVFIVRRAEELSTAAANALLKTLEEPGPRTHFVLLSSSASSLLPTVLSRTQRIRFGLLPDALVAELLCARRVDAARATRAASLAGGSMAQALVLADPDASQARDGFVSSALAALSAPDLGSALDVAEVAKKIDKELLVAWVRALAFAIGNQGLQCAELSDTRADVACARHALALAAVRQIEANASVQLAVEAMLIRMRSA